LLDSFTKNFYPECNDLTFFSELSYCRLVNSMFV
jgi:hypothetical protein